MSTNFVIASVILALCLVLFFAQLAKLFTLERLIPVELLKSCPAIDKWRYHLGSPLAQVLLYKRWPFLGVIPVKHFGQWYIYIPKHFYESLSEEEKFLVLMASSGRYWNFFKRVFRLDFLILEMQFLKCYQIAKKLPGIRFFTHEWSEVKKWTFLMKKYNKGLLLKSLYSTDKNPLCENIQVKFEYLSFEA
ncbi:MAG: hypothetical protein H6620_11545 [Halobacteriovoraceae bacterium]|nr:hypothetical protein [Halobacteriovoraceae bacterium]